MRIIRILGAFISIMTFGLIVNWTIDLYQRDIEDLPLIMALQSEMRIRPEDRGGDEISFKGLSVNGVLNERKKEFEKSEINLAPSAQDLLENEVSPVLVPEKQSEGNISESITAALETLLGVEKQKESPLRDGIELHIASYDTADKANAHWFLLQQVSSDLLVNYNHQVVKVVDLEKELYRLRIVGFESVAVAKDMCARLIERGENCVPSVDSQ